MSINSDFTILNYYSDVNILNVVRKFVISIQIVNNYSGLPATSAVLLEVLLLQEDRKSISSLQNIFTIFSLASLNVHLFACS